MTDKWLVDWSVGVIIPARNEEATTVRCIEAIFASLERAHVGSSWLVVVADGCVDRTATLARHALGSQGEVLEIRARAAGAARRAGVARVLQHFSGVDASKVWLANTDADTRVTADWMTVQLALADTGVTGVAGIVRLDADGCPAAQEVYRTTYRMNAEGTHSHVHGANLSMRADAYIDVGGWSNLAIAEDHCLWRRLRHRGWRLSSPVSSVVVTSARLKGRAAGGFADTLRMKILAGHASA